MCRSLRRLQSGVLRRWRGEHRRLWEGYDENIIPRPPPEPAVACAPVLWGGGCTGREPDTRMAFFSKPPTRKKPEPAKVDVRSRAGSGGADGRAASARELAAHAADRGGRRACGARGRRSDRNRREPCPVDAGAVVFRGRAGQSGVVRRTRERRASICGRPDGRRPPAARRGHRKRLRHQAFGARLARAVRCVAAPGRQGGVRPARSAVRRAVRAIGARVGGGRKAGSRAARVRRHRRGDRSADRGLGDADRGHPARDLTAVARSAARSRFGDRFRRRWSAPARQGAGRRTAGGVGNAPAGGNRNWPARSLQR